MPATVLTVMGGISCKFLKEDYDSITYTQQKILDIICCLFAGQRKKSRNGSMYCYPGQKKMGAWIGYCRKTVNENVKEMVSSQILSIQQRKPRHGHFRTLLYFVGALLRRAINAATAQKQTVLKSVTPGLHISSDKDKISSSEVAKRSKTTKIHAPPLHDVITRIENKHPELAT